jgi:hypothetical protein
MTDVESRIVQGVINPAGVVNPLVRAVRDSTEVIGLALSAIKSADTSEAPRVPDAFFHYTYKAGPRDPEERRQAYTTWLLAKGYHELARATREMLEEAYLYVELYKTIGTTITGKLVFDLREQAGGFRFPVLLARINEALPRSLIFAAEMQSLQKVRNCLEHRNGIVGQSDVDETGKLRLVLPVYAPFAQEEDGDVELHVGYRAKKETQIAFRRISRERTYELGERVAFSAEEFSEIAHSCWMLSQDLLDKLPHPSKTAIEAKPAS